jgi:TPR repeat protein
MPEVPVQIADSLEHLELEANVPQTHVNSAGRTHSDNYAFPPSSHSSGPRSTSEDPHLYQSSLSDDYKSGLPHIEESSDSPFPKLINPAPNVPLTDEEKGMQIESARMDVLSSNDPELQLRWAQDALNYVEISMNYRARISNSSQDRPETPPTEHQIRTDSISVVTFLADQHHPRAEFMRGNWLEFGKFGFRMDKKEAFRCYARAAEKGYSRAEYRMGMQFENSNEPMKAIKHYTRGAAAGDSASNYRLGMMTIQGQHGQPKDYAKGCHLIRMAAMDSDENAPQGAYVYGMLLARELPGIEIPENYLPVDVSLAREMIERAAFLGFARAQLKMGTAYELCQLGCEFNPVLSLHYNALAARQCEAEAEMAISKWFLCGFEGVFEKNEELAFVYAHRAALTGLGTAEFAIGYFYEIGMYVPVDLKEAQRWYSKAAAHGNKDATGRIDGISRSKTLSRKDHENVAVSKIRARHGSMRGKNPGVRIQASSVRASVSSISEVEMPEPPSTGNYNYPPETSPRQQQRQQPPQLHPVRTQSASEANSPLFRTDDSHGVSYGPQSAITQRPVTAQPYPSGPGLHSESDGPGRPTSSGYGPSRPMSGFPPPNRAYSEVTGGRGIILPAGTYPAGPLAHNTTAMSTRNSSGHQSAPLSTVPFKRPSYGGPPGPGRESHPGNQIQGYSPNIPRLSPDSQHGAPLARPDEASRPGVDIGFEAPPPKPSRSPAPRPPKSPAPQTLSPGNLGRPSYPNRVPSPMGPGPSGRTGLSASSPPMDGSYAPPSVPPPSPPLQLPDPVMTPKPVAAPQKPSKGPKTFEEMGVPQQTKEQDCVIM